MKKIHKCIIKKKKLDLFIKVKYINILIIILKTLWLKCSTTQFTFYNYALIKVLFNIY